MIKPVLFCFLFIVAEALEIIHILSVHNRNRDDVILFDLFAVQVLNHNLDGFLDHGRIIGDGEQVISFRFGDCLMLILQDSINLSKSGGAGKRLQLFMTAAGFSILSNRKEKSVRYVLITFFKVSIKSEGVWHPLFICAIFSPT